MHTNFPNGRTEFHVDLFNGGKCRLCGVKVRNGFARTAHSRKHVRAGEALETESRLAGRSLFTIPPQALRRGPSTYEVINLNIDPSTPWSHELGSISHGTFDTIEEARGCVSFDKLTYWEIWRGDTIVERNDGED